MDNQRAEQANLAEIIDVVGVHDGKKVAWDGPICEPARQVREMFYST
jgi:hypothetical protein